MLKWALILAVVAVFASLLGLSGLAGAAAWLAKLLFYAAVAISLLFLVLAVTIYRKAT